MKKKLVAIAQVYNELDKGNLKRFFRYLNPVVDEIVIYDDASTDGTYEYCLTQTKYVIRGKANSFASETDHKQQLIEYAKKLKAGYILSIDADEVLTKDAKKHLQKWLPKIDDGTYDGLSFMHQNLWRSDTYARVDSQFDENWPTRLWKVTSSLSFTSVKEGLHGILVPPQILKTAKVKEISLLHYGFADDRNIAYKYFIYKKHGQRGYLMLDRLLDEKKLALKKLDKSIFPAGLWKAEKSPTARTFEESFQAVSVYKEQIERPKYSVVCLIYKSVEWLKFVNEQVLKYTDLSDKEFIFVANDPTPEVENYLRDNYLPYHVYHAPAKYKDDWYIKNVYRAWNYAGEVARGEFIIFINSDMAFTPNWSEKLIAEYDGHNCVASRLVESGKLRSGQYGIEKNFGRHFSEYKEKEFLKYAEKIAADSMMDSGLFMPLLIKRTDFLDVGGYPEGNIVEGSNIYKPKIAERDDKLTSGDVVLMQKLKDKGIRHQTSFNSIVYHFQTGEMDELPHDKMGKPVEVAICNDLVTGTLGEKVLWDYLIESLPGAYGVDKRLVGKKSFEEKAKQYIDQKHAKTKIIVQNATFIGTIDPNRYTIAFLQDDLRKMGNDSVTQEANLKVARKIVTNSIRTAASYSEYDLDIVPIGLNDRLFAPADKQKMRLKHGLKDKKKIGIFVGSFSEVKGWSKITECIKKRPDIFWLLVTKYDEAFSAPNAKVYSKIDQSLLAELLNCADFFILGSPVETQCLAALEAGLCEKPILMPLTGIFSDWSEEDRRKIGIFTNDLSGNIDRILKGNFTPRKIIEKNCNTIDGSIAKWRQIIERSLQEEQNIKLMGKAPKFQQTKYKKYPIGMIIRKKILKPIIGREYVFTSSVTFAVIRFTYRTLSSIGLEPLMKKTMQIIRGNKQ